METGTGSGLQCHLTHLLGSRCILATTGGDVFDDLAKVILGAGGRFAGVDTVIIFTGFHLGALIVHLALTLENKW